MGLVSNMVSILSILLVLLVFKQYLDMWIILDRMKFKFLKYTLPILEIILLIFLDSLFLLPSVLCFLALIYKGEIFQDNAFKSFYIFNRKEFLPNKKIFIYITFISPIIFFLSHGILDLFIYIVPIKEDSLGYNFYNNKQIIDYLILFGLTCIVAPIVEEFTFRVLIYRNWFSRTFKRKISAVILSSIIFTFSHFDLKTSIYTFIISVILSIVYDFYGYLGSVFLHMLLNLYTFLGVTDIQITIKIVASILVIIVILGIIIFDKNKRGINNKNKQLTTNN